MLAVDSSTPPPVLVPEFTGGGPATTAPFTAPTGALLLVAAQVGSTYAGGSVGPWITDTGGLSWQLAGRAGGTSAYDEAVLWWAVTTTAIPRTVTVVGASDNSYAKYAQVIVFTGQDPGSPIGTVAQGTATGLLSVQVPCSRTGSWLWGIYADWSNGAAPTPGSGVTRYSAATPLTAATLYCTAAGAEGQPMMLSTTAPSGPLSWVAVEILPVAASGTGTGTVSGLGTLAVGEGHPHTSGAAALRGTAALSVLGGSAGQPGEGSGQISGNGVLTAAGVCHLVGSGQIHERGSLTGRPLLGGVIYAVPNVQAGRIDLQVAWTGPNQPATVTVTRSDPTGTVIPVRSAAPATLTSGQWVGADVEAPADRPVWYTATEPAGSAVISQPVTLPGSTGYWLISPGRPSLSMRITPAEDHATTKNRTLPQGVFQVLGREDPIVVSGRRWAPTTTLKILTFTDEERRALEALLDDGQTLYYRAPAADAAGDDSGYIAVGAYDSSRIGYGLPARVHTLPVTYTGRPSGLGRAASPGDGIGAGGGTGTTYGGTWADVLATYQTWADVTLAKTSWTALETAIAPAAAPGSP
ncbi:hypothetical protein [Frankia sp. AvcI1]|uniref:hypothetical protein n=1 Tax=Frankia sp. AvcI1 TaxID=573496 RepID=UPI002118EBD6|nr:hypothetical protein [Frankia sp. AvcI1]